MNSDLAAYRTWATTPLDAVEWSIVVPAYNEAIRILPTVGAIAAHISTLGQPWELVVADDGSTDDTVSLLNDLDLENLRVLVAEANGGKGSAVRRGMQAARGNVLLFADADQSTPIEQFGALLAAIEGGADVAIGSRASDGAEVVNKSTSRRIFSWGLNQIVRRGFGVRVADSQCGFKMFTRAAAEELFSHQVVDEFSFDLEILYLAEKRGMKIAEIPVEWIDAPGSTVDPARVAVEFLRDMAKIRLNDLRGVYVSPNHAWR